MAIRHSVIAAAALAASLLGVVAHAAPVTISAARAHALLVDDDDGGAIWFPLWFGFRAFVPRRPVIIERNYYPPPPPPPTYYYYCRDPQGYYPRIPNCPSGWLRVVPPGEGGPP
ncbi:hypothetical protein [Acidiferrobacter sp.]|uniref:hypothetical protein n=1 Tax=Acidiferrobacter sp. TaxID=1872107 RepID=UPI00261D8B6D|nr:hypothetical protein [Acidiferrobacter sp.]